MPKPTLTDAAFQPFPDWPPCRVSTQGLNLAEALALDPDKYVLIVEAKYGGYVVALLAPHALQHLLTETPTLKPEQVKLKYYHAVTWAKAYERVISDIKYEAQNGKIIDPMTGGYIYHASQAHEVQ